LSIADNVVSEQVDVGVQAANTLRMLAIDAVREANSGHPGLPLGAADIVTALWTRVIKYDPATPDWPDRDRFVLSAGHGSALLYSLLYLLDLLPVDELKQFRQWGSSTPGHPEYNVSHGIEMTTGPLGQGFSSAVGMAIAERWLAVRFNRPGFPIVDHYTYVLASDGDLMEGISHEAASLAGHLGLGKLIVLFDDNGITIDGPADLSCSDDVLGRFEAYGWHTASVDGHDITALENAIRGAQAEIDRPSIIACRTHIGYGSPLQGTSKAHGAPLGPEAFEETKKHFGWPLESSFYVPDDVHRLFDVVREQGAQAQAEWEGLFQSYREAYPALAVKWERMLDSRSSEGWKADLPIFSEGQAMATRAASGKFLDAVAPLIPSLLGGSADLSGSNNTAAGNVSAIRRDDFSGAYIHYGIREHAMGAVMNGLALHGGVRPYGGTFLVFSDYMRPAIRLAALMKLPVIYVFTHDSIGVGEDGPTHQPIEHLAALRTIPNLTVIRPADANEVVAAWRVALCRTDGPTALILTRQKVPTITPIASELHRGAYVLCDTDSEKPNVILIATGSEVSLALSVREQLVGSGIPARVVSMPSWELFDAQPADYQQRVLPRNTPVVVAIEAGVTPGWRRYVKSDGLVCGIDQFGASAPCETLYEKYGLTAEEIAGRIYSLLR
jgi:transketolase